jgi:hypothetical protein
MKYVVALKKLYIKGSENGPKDSASVVNFLSFSPSAPSASLSPSII